jgi:hypothetical protein
MPKGRVVKGEGGYSILDTPGGGMAGRETEQRG